MLLNGPQEERVKSACLSPAWKMEGIQMEAGRDFSQLRFRHMAFEVMVPYQSGDVLYVAGNRQGVQIQARA